MTFTNFLSICRVTGVLTGNFCTVYRAVRVVPSFYTVRTVNSCGLSIFVLLCLISVKFFCKTNYQAINQIVRVNLAQSSDSIKIVGVLTKKIAATPKLVNLLCFFSGFFG